VNGTVVARRTATDCEIISFTECNNGTTQNLPFGIKTVAIKNLTATSVIIYTLDS